MADGVPVADIQDGLVYNCLFYGDSASVIMRVGEEGLALNNTIVAAREGDVAIDSTSARVGAMQNILMVNATDTSSMNCFAPYLTSKNPYLLPSVYYDNYPALAFQFHEHSPKINAGVNQAELPDLFNDYIADKIVDFDFDRDVLGNPRKIGARVDLGAFETWRVEPNTAVALTAITYRLIGEQESTSATEENLRRAFRDNNGGHRYPHAGSVVYLMDSSAMTMQYEDLDFVDFHGTPFALSPGYVLLKQGASFYGNGHLVSFRYVAAEKRFVNQRYSMTSFPFDYSIENITSTSYNSERDSMIFNLAPVDFHTYHYSGAARSAKDYMFQTENSTLWQPISTATRTATEGYLMDFDSTIVDTLLRFTSFALNAYTPVYIEDDVDKIVYLDQYDHRTAGEGTGLDFTRQEDMGWNMKGLPWLVSDYRTDTLLEEDNFQRQMFIPHVLYQMDGAGDYILSEGDKVWSARSWDRGTTVSIGNAFLLQTATTQPQEAVYFHLPYYALNNKVGRQLISITAKGRNGRSVTSDILTIMPDENVSKTVRYTYGRDAIKWFSSMEEVQFYLLDDKKQSRISLLGAAPTEVDIPLGVKVPAEMDYTFSLPEKEAFGDYGYVWLIDYAHNHYTNLLDEDYTVALEAGENNTRFAVRIGGYPKTDESGRRQYVVFASDGMLYVRGLVAGDRITVYSPSGQLVTHATATTAEWSMPLFYQSGYVVKVNNKAYKVLNM